MRKTNKNLAKLSWLMIFTTLTVFIWVGLEIYRMANKTTITPVLQEQLEPLDPSLDGQTINSLKERKLISLEQLAQAPEIVTFELEEEEIEATLGGEIVEEEIGGTVVEEVEETVEGETANE